MTKQLRLAGTLPERHDELDEAAEALRVAHENAQRARDALLKAQAVLRQASNEEDDLVMLNRVKAEKEAGDRRTLRDLRSGNGISKERAETALNRLRLRGQVREVESTRLERGRPKDRLLWEPIGAGK